MEVGENSLEYADTILQIASIVISLISLFFSICALWIRRPLTLKVNPVEWCDSFEVLYGDAKFRIQCANYSNQDILLHLRNGYIRIKIQDSDKYEMHKVKENYYTLKASSLTEVDIHIDTCTVDNSSRCKKRAFLNFEYNNGIKQKKITYKQE